ncbi:YqzE family protein [Paenibacillus sp. MWE-103]|uniref:YqzE family protein n=1 Tax=Paenibacillus artemisiicola TaxID=1172618 RepID=A0ABS3W995_9BACL|nr:YqzE family protein [Paenibacillus artemisiicola]MBO7744887.1 YqzE family protein [Paenibacillus artemisiicola]
MEKRTEEYIRYMTDRVVDYMETPQAQRKENRKKAKAAREPWLTRWFGLGGFAISQWMRSSRD